MPTPSPWRIMVAVRVAGNPARSKGARHVQLQGNLVGQSRHGANRTCGPAGSRPGSGIAPPTWSRRPMVPGGTARTASSRAWWAVYRRVAGTTTGTACASPAPGKRSDGGPTCQEEHVKDLETDGVYAGVIYPTVGLLVFSLPDSQLLAAIMAAYNDWLAGVLQAIPSPAEGHRHGQRG